jgi:hypothetical protein
VIQILNEKFVPFAPSWSGNQQKYPWFVETRKKFAKGKGQGSLPGTLLWMTTSAGTLLTGKSKGNGGQAESIKEVLRDYARLPKEERRPAKVEGQELGVPAPPPGGAVLTIYDRALARDEDGSYRLRAPKRDDQEMAVKNPGHYRPEWFGQRSSLWLTKEKCAALMPKDPRTGQDYDVPTKLTKRLTILGLWPQTIWVVAQRWEPNCFRDGQLRLTVEEVSAKAVKMRIHGRVLLESKATFAKLNGKATASLPEEVKNLNNRYDARLEGRIVYDPAKRKITGWQMVALGDYTGIWVGYREDGWRGWTLKPVPFGFSFELDRTDYEVSPERRRPASFQFNYVFKGREQFYWDMDKWLEDWKKRKR